MADQILKQWNVTSGNPRDSHAEMDGEEVPINEPFSNGLMYPGDPTGDVGEVAGCTCVMTISGTAVAPTEVPGSRQVFATPRSLNEMVDEAEKVRETYPAEVADSHAIPLTTAELRAGEVSDTARAWDARIAEYGSSSDETVQLYRAVPKEVADQLKVGEQFTDRGFLYAHEDPGIGTAFPDGAAMQLNIPPGMKWIYGDSFPGERILGRDITWEVSDDRFVTVINSRGEATEMRMFTLTPQEAAAEVLPDSYLNVANRDTLIEDWKSERQKWLDSLPSDLRTRAEDFESTRMYGLNAALRGGTSVPISSIDYTVENGVEDLIDHGVVTEEPTVYFRGLGTQTMEVGDTYVDHGYAFMSRSPGVAAEFTHGVADAPILRITVEPGARSFFGNYTHYTESIFERDMEFEVTGQTTGFVNVWKDGRAVSTEFPVLEVTARAPERAIAEAVTTEEPTVTQAVTDSYDSMSATDLRAELRSRGLPSSFNKPQLIEMLRADDGVGTLAEESATAAPVAEPVTLPAPTPEPVAPAPARDYESMSSSELRDELRRRGYPTSYTKPRLIEMLQEDDNLTSPNALITPDTSLVEDATAPRKPFKTTQEAEDYVAQVMRTVQEAEGGTAVPFPTHFTWENLAGETKTLKPAVANAIADAMDELTAKAPGSLSKLLSLRVEVDPSVGDAYAWVDSKYPGTIVLNGDIMGGNLGRIEGLLAKDARHGFAATDGIEGLISHELGHVTLGTSGFAGAAQMLNDAGFTMDMYENAGSWLSKYAASSKAEFMGELYSAAVSGVANERVGQEFIDAFRQQLIKNGYLEAVTP